MDHGRRESLLALLSATAAAVALGALLGLSSLRMDDPPVGAAQAILVVVCATTITLSGRSCVQAASGYGPWTHLGSLFIGVGSIFAFVLPGIQLLGGNRESRLAQQGLVVGDVAIGVAQASLVVAMALTAFFLGELLAARITARRLDRKREQANPNWNTQATWVILVVLSFAPILLLVLGPESPREVFTARGTAEGRGAAAVLGWAPALAVSLAVLRHHFNSRIIVGASIALVAFLVLAGNRSPLLLIFLAVALRFLFSLDSPLRTVRGVLAIATAGYLAAVTLVAISDWRGEIIRGQQASLAKSSTEALSNPLGKLGGAGLDSLDGLVLSTKVDRAVVGAHWTDPSKVVTGFIPHQLWPAKPNWLTIDVSRAYLRFQASGMFLSGAGYSWLIWGGAIGTVLAFFLLGLGSSLIFSRQRATFGIGALLTIYFVVRFSFAGDAFDGFHALGLAGLALLAAQLGRAAVAMARGA